MSKYGVGIIGCGGIFSSHAFPLHTMEETEVKAVCDNKPGVLEIARSRFGCDGYTDYSELLEREDIDVVHILTPHYLHAPMTIAAANKGKHVLIEKPMSISMEEANAIIEAGKRNGITIGVISQNRYNAASVAIKDAITSGSLGKVIGQRVDITGTKPMDYFQNSDWRGTWDKEGGSLIIDQGIHILDLARWFIGDQIKSVQATIANRNHPEIETEDTAEGLITYRNGVKSVFFATNNFTYNAPIVVETHCENGIALMEFDRAIITYKNGKEITAINDPTVSLDEVEFEAFFNESIRQLASRTLREWGVVPGPITWKGSRTPWRVTHDIQIKNFYSSLATGCQPDISAEVAIKTQELVCAIYQSAREGRNIEL